MPNYAYCQCEALKLFWNELWPLEFFVHITFMDIFCEVLLNSDQRLLRYSAQKKCPYNYVIYRKKSRGHNSFKINSSATH